MKELRRFLSFVLQKSVLACCKAEFVFFFFLGFLSQIFAIHRTAGERGGYLFISFLSLPLASQALDISWVIAAKS